MLGWGTSRQKQSEKETLLGGIQWRIQGGARGPTPFIFRPNWAPPPPILPSYLKVFIRHWNGIFKYYEQDIKQFNFYCCCVSRLPSFSSYIVHNRGLMQLFYCDITQLCVIRTSSAFDTLPHGLIVLKLKQCQVDDKIINLIKDYLFNRRQRVKLGNVILHGRIQRREFPKYPYLALFYSTYLWTILFTW